MKHRLNCLLLAGALCLGLTACTPTGEAETPPLPTQQVTPPPATPTPEPFSPPGEFPEASSLPLGKYEPWQKAYMHFISQNCILTESSLRLWAANATSAEIDADPERWEAVNMCSQRYWLYDVDKDGIPELFIQYGNGEAAYETTCYTYREEAVSEAGSFPSGHATLCSYPGENGFLFYWAHLGVALVDKYTLEDGALVNQGEIYTADLSSAEMGEAPRPGEILEGSEELPSYYTRVNTRIPDSGALLLPICDYDRSLLQAPSLTEEAVVREAIGKVLWDGESFLGVSGDNSYGFSGPLTLEEYLQTGDVYSEEPLAVRDLAWADANGDGQTDCILRFTAPERDLDADLYVILSWQSGQVYGYFFNLLTDAAVDPDGSVYFRQWEDWRKVSFYKDQCYTAPSPAPVVGDGLAWDSFH